MLKPDMSPRRWQNVKTRYVPRRCQHVIRLSQCYHVIIIRYITQKMYSVKYFSEHKTHYSLPPPHQSKPKDRICLSNEWQVRPSGCEVVHGWVAGHFDSKGAIIFIIKHPHIYDYVLFIMPDGTQLLKNKKCLNKILICFILWIFSDWFRRV